MNPRTLIHAFLIVALCFGQLAATVHMTGHFHAEVTGHSHACHPDDGHSHRAACHSQSHSLLDHHDSQHHKTHPHPTGIHTAVVDTGEHHTDNNDVDCAIYHAYLGQGGCLSHANTGSITLVDSIVLKSRAASAIATLALSNHPIRGPPSVS